MFEKNRKDFPPIPQIKTATDIGAFHFSRDVFPWLGGGEETKITKLALITFDDGKQIVVGSRIDSDKFGELLRKLNPMSRKKLDKDFYQLAFKIAHLDFQPLIKIRNPVGNLQIYYDKSSLRYRLFAVYIPAGEFKKMFQSIQLNCDALIRVALCLTSDEERVLDKLCTS
jgi:hypothetical protein